MQNSELLTVVPNSGIQTVLPELSQFQPQLIYIDFDGEITSYHNRDLDIHVNDVEVEDAGLSAERIASIVQALNDEFAGQNVVFVTERPTNTEYSTIYVGKTSSFNQYGNFAGLAETVDVGNAIKNDNAFVMLDATDSDTAIIKTISHEAGHLVGKLEHGGEGITYYGASPKYYTYYIYENNHTYANIDYFFHCYNSIGLNDKLVLSKYNTSITYVSSSLRLSGTQHIYFCIGSRYVSAMSCVVKEKGILNVLAGGKAYHTTVLSGGSLYIYKGYAYNTGINFGGSMAVVSGGLATSTWVGGYFKVASGGTATDITTYNGGNAIVGNGGTAISAGITSGQLTIHSGGTANSVWINGGGKLYANGTVNSATLNSGGVLAIQGGNGNDLILSAGGKYDLAINTYNHIQGTSGGADFNLKNGNTLGFTIRSGHVSALNGTTLKNISIDNGGGLFVFKGGTASNAIVNAGGWLALSGTANSTLINLDGWLSVKDGGVAKFTSARQGKMAVSSGGSVSNTTISKDGRMVISSGGKASNTTITDNGLIYVSGGGVANGNTVISSATLYNYGKANNTTLNNGNFYLQSGGIASDTVINSDGVMHVLSACLASNTTINGGKMYINGCGVANHVSVCDGILHLYTGGSALNIVEDGGAVSFSDKTKVSFLSNTITSKKVDNSGSMTVHSATTANYTSIDDGTMTVYGGKANNTIINNGTLTVSDGGKANNTIVNNGTLTVSEGAIINSSVLSGGWLQVRNKGIVSNTTISGGSMTMVSGGKHCGTLQIASGAVVSAYTSSIIDFTLTGRSANEACLINDITRIVGAPIYTITVKSDQANGTYRLAGNAANFKKNITLTIDGTNTSQTFTYQGGQYNTITIGGKEYSLVKSDNELCLQVGGKKTPKLSVDFSIDEIQQIEYYDGDTGGQQLKGTVFKVPYVATATITLDKDIPDGVYNFAAVLTDYNNAKSYFQLKVEEGMPEVVCNERKGVCYFAEKTDETTTSTTWTIAGIEDYILTDKADSSMPIGIRYVADGSFGLGTHIKDGVSLTVGSTDNNADTINKNEIIDANKKGFFAYSIKWQEINQEINDTYQVSVSPYDSNNDFVYDKYLIKVEYFRENNSNPIIHTTFVDLKSFDDFYNTTITVPFSTILGCKLEITLKQDCEASINKYDESNQRITMFLKEGSVDGNYHNSHAIKQDGHCWVATAANMLYKGGYLDNMTAQQCFETLSNSYFKIEGNKSEGGKVLKVFNDLGLNSKYVIYYDRCKNDAGEIVYNGDAEKIYKGLENLKDNNSIEVAAAISIIGHVFTCLEVESLKGKYSDKGKLEEAEATIRYSDSDDYLQEPKENNELNLQLRNGRWIIKNHSTGIRQITGFVTLIGYTTNTTDVKIKLDKIKLTPVSKDSFVCARCCSDVSTIDGNTVVNGSITDGVVESEGVLEIASGAVADTLNIHTNAAVLMDTGSIVTGRVVTYGGTISVAAGVDVSEAEFEFNLTNLTAGNEAMLDNLQNAQAADFNVTIGCDQTTGTYVLANGATGFEGEVTICGATFGDYDLRPGFADGELGTLAVGETLEIANQLFTLAVEDDALALNIAWSSLRILSVEANHSGYLTIEPVTVTAVFSEDIVHPEYSLDGEYWMEYINGVTLTENGFVWFRGSDAEGKQSEAVSYEVYNIIHYYSVEGGDANGIELPESTSRQLLEFSNDDYQHSLQLEVDANRVNLHALPSGTYCWKARDVYDVEWSIGNEFFAEESQETQLLNAADDGNFDAFFGNARGVWAAGYNARHVGVGEWSGTRQAVALEGKNKIADIFQGANDASILLLTDDANGDALFVDDIYSAFPDGMEAQARIAQIDEIRAGAGDDVIDLTSQRFEYVGNGMTIHGGSGDDVIWANQGENILFGDAGNDQIIGASGNDIIAGGSGDDTLHGGGGDDIFTFSMAWGNDSVEQLIGGNTLLWFYDVAREDLSLTADANGDAVLSCGDDTVTILNVKHDDVSATFASGENQLLMGVSLRFGYDGSEQYTELLAAGAFDGFTSEKIFEDKNKAMLA